MDISCYRNTEDLKHITFVFEELTSFRFSYFIALIKVQQNIQPQREDPAVFQKYLPNSTAS